VSLIDEALRRARQEAARQDASRREERYRQVPVLPPMARRSSSPRPALIGAAVALCVVAGIGIGVMLGGRKAGEPAPVLTPAPAPAAAPLPTVPEKPAAIVEEVPQPTPEPSLPAPTPAPPAREVPVIQAEPVNPLPSLDPSPPPPAPEPTPQAPAPETAPESAPAVEVRTYVREVPLPDGGVLRLNGIAFSAAQPVALIDDRVLGKGESYQGFTVTDIQTNVVELQGNGMTVRVSLK
jgi:hypothetical protein